MKLVATSGLLPRLIAGGFATCLVSLPQPLLACAACFGKSDDSLARGMNMGIFALLFVIVSVLAGLASFAIFLARRSARFPLSPSSAGSGAEFSAPTAPTTK